MSAIPDKIYLNVPFPEKDRAKGLGARWDPAARKWYVGGRTQLAAFREWLPPDLDLNDSEAVEALASETTTTERGVALSAFLAQVSDAIAVHVPKSQWVRAEISQLRAINGGHLAIELVEHDAEGQLTARVQAFVWHGRAAFIQEKFEQATGAHLAAGLKVMFQLSAEFRPTYGLRTIVEDVDPAYTLGDIEAKLKAIRDALTAEGVITLNRELLAPVEFCHVAVVSPLEAAGLGDFRRDADRLHEAGICRFDYYTAKFQGQDAPASLLEALARVLADYEAGQRFDAVCIIRGGGSVTDLYWLNDLALARAICRLPVPVFTGIGHERDNTILDEVAHRRCDTPSKVIGWISGTVYANANAAIENLLSILKTAGDAIAINERTIELLRREVESLGIRMLNTTEHEMVRWVDEIRHRTLSRLQTAEHDLSRHVHEIRLLSLSRISTAEQDLDHQRAVISQLGGQRIAEAAQAIEAYAREILGQGPKATLQRGFALAHGQDGKPVTSARDARKTRDLDLEFHDGTVPVHVIDPLKGTSS